MDIPKYRRPLNHYQIQLLQTLYKFRFATTYLIANSQGSKHPRVITSRLKILLDQDYIGRNYDNSYKIKGKPAIYYLRPNGIRYLRLQSYSNKKVIDSIYHDKRTSQTQIDHCLNLFEIYVRFKKLYPGTFRFYSKSELAGRPNLPEDAPDARVTRIKTDSKKDNDYFLESYEDSIPYRRLIIKIRRFISYAENGSWEKLTENKLPTVLMVCESKTLQYRVMRLVHRELDSSYVDLKFLTILKEELAKDSSDIPKWIRISDENELVLI